jgi:hypothetical protein
VVTSSSIKQSGGDYITIDIDDNDGVDTSVTPGAPNDNMAIRTQSPYTNFNIIALNHGKWKILLQSILFMMAINLSMVSIYSLLR